jgi:hypothetical protein
MPRRLGPLAALVLALPLLSGCGGSGSNDPTFTSVNVFLAAEGANEGTLGSGGSIAENAASLEVGDRESINPPGPVRAFVSFNLGSIPPNAIITFAQLRLEMTNVTGNPFPAMGSVIVDHVNYGNQFPPATAYSGITNLILGNIGTLTTDATLGVKTVSVTFSVGQDRAAGRARSQFRVHFATADNNNDGFPSFVRFVDAEQVGGPGSIPLLQVTYDVPN